MRKTRKAYEEAHASGEKSLHVKPQALNAYRVRLLRSKLDEEINDQYDIESRNRSMEEQKLALEAARRTSKSIGGWKNKHSVLNTEEDE